MLPLAILAATAALTVESATPGAMVTAGYDVRGAVTWHTCPAPCVLDVPRGARFVVVVRAPGYELGQPKRLEWMSGLLGTYLTESTVRVDLRPLVTPASAP